MTDNEILCWFMWAKHEYVQEFFPTIKYMTKKDEEAILSWSPQIASAILDRLLSEHNHFKKEESDKSICPFCLQYNYIESNCKKCEFRKNHRDCGDYNSTYQKLSRKVGKNRNIHQFLKEYNYLQFCFKEIQKLRKNRNYEFIRS